MEINDEDGNTKIENLRVELEPLTKLVTEVLEDNVESVTAASAIPTNEDFTAAPAIPTNVDFTAAPAKTVRAIFRMEFGSKVAADKWRVGGPVESCDFYRVKPQTNTEVSSTTRTLQSCCR